MHPPCSQVTLPDVLWYCPVAGLNCLKVSWKQSREAEFDSPSPKELDCFLISLKKCLQKVWFRKNRYLYTSLPVISARTQCCTMHKTEAACGHQQARELLWSLVFVKLILAGHCPAAPGLKLMVLLWGTPTHLPSRHCCFLPACPFFRESSKPPPFEF